MMAAIRHPQNHATPQKECGQNHATPTRQSSCEVRRRLSGWRSDGSSPLTSSPGRRRELPVRSARSSSQKSNCNARSPRRCPDFVLTGVDVTDYQTGDDVLVDMDPVDPSNEARYRTQSLSCPMIAGSWPQVAVDRFLGDRRQRFIGESKSDIYVEQLLIPFNQRILGL
jgi:hypothetical protein